MIKRQTDLKTFKIWLKLIFFKCSGNTKKQIISSHDFYLTDVTLRAQWYAPYVNFESLHGSSQNWIPSSSVPSGFPVPKFTFVPGIWFIMMTTLAVLRKAGCKLSHIMIIQTSREKIDGAID